MRDPYASLLTEWRARRILARLEAGRGTEGDLSMADILALMTADGPRKARIVEGRVELQPQEQITGNVSQEIHEIAQPAVVVEFDGYTMALNASERTRITQAMTVALASIITGTEPGNTRWADPESEFTVTAMDGTSLVLDAHSTLRFGKEMVKQGARQ